MEWGAHCVLLPSLPMDGRAFALKDVQQGFGGFKDLPEGVFRLGDGLVIFLAGGVLQCKRLFEPVEPFLEHTELVHDPGFLLLLALDLFVRFVPLGAELFDTPNKLPVGGLEGRPNFC
eukprot:385423_1